MKSWRFVAIVIFLGGVVGCGKKREPSDPLHLGTVRRAYENLGFVESDRKGKLSIIRFGTPKPPNEPIRWKGKEVHFILFETDGRTEQDYILYQKVDDIEERYIVVGGTQRIDFESPEDLAKLPAFFRPVLSNMLSDETLDRIRASEEEGKATYRSEFAAKKDGAASGKTEDGRYIVDFCVATGHPWARKIVPKDLPWGYAFDFDSYD